MTDQKETARRVLRAAELTLHAACDNCASVEEALAVLTLAHASAVHVAGIENERAVSHFRRALLIEPP